MAMSDDSVMGAKNVALKMANGMTTAVPIEEINRLLDDYPHLFAVKQPAPPPGTWEPYKLDDALALIDSTFAKVKELHKVKGGEYAGDVDRLANFRRNATRLGLQPETVWAVYFNKHIDALMQYISDLEHGKSRPSSEPITGRALDAVTYLILFLALHDAREKMAQGK